MNSASIATLRCPAGAAACSVTAPKTVKVKIGGKSYKLRAPAGTVSHTVKAPIKR